GGDGRRAHAGGRNQPAAVHGRSGRVGAGPLQRAVQQAAAPVVGRGPELDLGLNGDPRQRGGDDDGCDDRRDLDPDAVAGLVGPRVHPCRPSPRAMTRPSMVTVATCWFALDHWIVGSGIVSRVANRATASSRCMSPIAVKTGTSSVTSTRTGTGSSRMVTSVVSPCSTATAPEPRNSRSTPRLSPSVRLPDGSLRGVRNASRRRSAGVNAKTVSSTVVAPAVMRTVAVFAALNAAAAPGAVIPENGMSTTATGSDASGLTDSRSPHATKSAETSTTETRMANERSAGRAIAMR